MKKYKEVSFSREEFEKILDEDLNSEVWHGVMGDEFDNSVYWNNQTGELIVDLNHPQTVKFKKLVN